MPQYNKFLFPLNAALGAKNRGMAERLTKYPMMKMPFHAAQCNAGMLQYSGSTLQFQPQTVANRQHFLIHLVVTALSTGYIIFRNRENPYGPRKTCYLRLHELPELPYRYARLPEG
jgi:hypothetical protein